MKMLMLGVVCFSIISCSGAEFESDGTVEVFKSSVNVLCGSGVGTSIAESELSLTEMGVDVSSSRCANVLTSGGDIDCQFYERINVHAINRSNIVDAASLDYIELGTLSELHDLTEESTVCL